MAKTSKPGHSSDILSGYHCVGAALAARRRRIHTVFLSGARTDRRMERLADQAAAAGVPVSMTDTRRLDAMTGGAGHQGVAASASPFPVQRRSDLLTWVHRQSGPFRALVLDQVEDPRNLGALIRTGLCTGVACVVIPSDRSAQPGPAVCRASAGAMEHARIFVVPNIVSALGVFKKQGTWVVGLDAEGQTPLYRADLSGSLVLVVGGEHKGMRPIVAKACDMVLSIPLTGPVTSLNASVAGSMAMYEAMRQQCDGP